MLLKTLHSIPAEVVASLERGDEAWLGVTGRSMLPTLRPGDDVVLLRRVDVAELRRFDVVLAVTDSGTAVLHRVVSIDRDRAEAVLMGDGNLSQRERVDLDSIFGRVEEVMRCGREQNFRLSRFAGGAWVALLPVRRVLVRLLPSFNK